MHAPFSCWGGQQESHFVFLQSPQQTRFLNLSWSAYIVAQNNSTQFNSIAQWFPSVVLLNVCAGPQLPAHHRVQGRLTADTVHIHGRPGHPEAGHHQRVRLPQRPSAHGLLPVLSQLRQSEAVKAQKDYPSSVIARHPPASSR